MLKLKCLLHSASVWMLDETERSLLPSWSRWRLLVALLVDVTLVSSLVSNEVIESLAEFSHRPARHSGAHMPIDEPVRAACAKSPHVLDKRHLDECV